jgi:hypothetical protein
LTDRPERAAEFERDRRTGRPVVSTPESVDRMIRCFPEGLILVDSYRWRSAAYVDDATADLIARRTEPVPLPTRTRLLAFRWANGDARTSEACADLRQLIRPDRQG